jgi:hypothetical protein
MREICTSGSTRGEGQHGSSPTLLGGTACTLTCVGDIAMGK